MLSTFRQKKLEKAAVKNFSIRDIVQPSMICFLSYLDCFCITHTHTHLTALCPGLPRWAGTRKVKLIWILLKQETVSGTGISWAICKSAPRSRQITTPAPHRSVFYRPDALLPPNQQCQSTEGTVHFYSVSVLLSFINCPSMMFAVLLVFTHLTLRSMLI